MVRFGWIDPGRLYILPDCFPWTVSLACQSFRALKANTLVAFLSTMSSQDKHDSGHDRYVCAFIGRRDDYEVPVALDEGGLLDCLVTDLYATPFISRFAALLPASVGRNLLQRMKPGLDPLHVQARWWLFVLYKVLTKLGLSLDLVSTWTDRAISKAAMRRASAGKSHLFLYSSYAWEAFTAAYHHNVHKVLFQYHPFAETETEILARDREAYREIFSWAGNGSGQYRPSKWEYRVSEVWKHADRIVCASSFTRQTMIAAGADPQKISVVPYGNECSASVPVSAPQTFRCLFVGSGIQRKGLHHLLLAWQQAKLPENSELVLVCRVVDAALEPLVARTPRVRLVRGATPDELLAHYRDAALFVLPSLVEGFGLVYLEAMGQGCPVLGTPHSCLPDMGNEAGGVFMCPVGEIDTLAQTLESLAPQITGNLDLRIRVHARARHFSRERFREGIRAQCRH
jgi:glycosyltransferase involved in cell wall biosynthesis